MSTPIAPGDLRGRHLGLRDEVVVAYRDERDGNTLVYRSMAPR